MRVITTALIAALLLAAPVRAQVVGSVVHTLDATEARQGVASDGVYAYAIDNSRIGKYDLKTGQRIAAWEGEPALFPHMNACTLADRRLVCAASNYPRTPMTSAIEIFDPVAMKHLSTISLGMDTGSLTWIDRKGGFWWAGFANYDGKGGDLNRDHRYTTIVKFDDQWRRLEAFALPEAVLERMAPFSTSGGGWGDDGLLYVTGHDRPEMYVLRLPRAGSVLELAATIEIPFGGQAIDWDPKAKRLLWGISRKDRKTIAVTVPEIEAMSLDNAAMTIYGDSISGNCLKVKFVAEYLGLPFDWVETSVMARQTRSPEFLALNPAGQVPVVVFAGKGALAQSNAIILHLAENTDLIPTDAFARAQMYQWLFWEQYSHEPVIAVRRFHKHFLEKPDAEIEPSLLPRGNAILGLMEAHLAARDYFVGDGLTLADVALVAYTRFAHQGGFELPPHVRAWVRRVEIDLNAEHTP